MSLYTRTLAALIGLPALVACGLWSGESQNLAPGSGLPLTTAVRLAPSAADAALEYNDACGGRQTLPIQDRLRKRLLRQLGLAFDSVYLEGSSKKVPDGLLELGLGLREVELHIPRSATRKYPAIVTLGAEAVYREPSGAELLNKRLKVTRTGEVSVEASKCEVQGLEDIANETVDYLVEGIAKHLGTSTILQGYAEQKKSGKGPLREGNRTEVAPVVLPSAAPALSSAEESSPVEVKTDASQVSRGLSDHGAASPTKLTFRALLRDENRNHVLEDGEQLSVEVYVHNEGPSVAQGVEVHLNGTPGVVQHLSTPLRIGELPPGEQRRVTVAGTVPKLEEAEQAELTLTIRASGSSVQVPTPKKFLMAVRPAGEEVEVLSVGVDQLPRRLKGYEQTKAVGVAIGVGSFKDTTVAASRFAVRDATVMAGYLKTASGVPEKQVRLLTDDQASRDDFVSLFESWLPAQVKPQGMVYVYFSGRGVVEPETGAVFLVPYDGKPGAQERLYSLRRLHAALGRLPVERAVILLEVSLEPTGEITSGRTAARWDPDERDVPRGKIVQMIGNTTIQDAHEYQHGQHGLFTYYLLKGLRGEADVKQTGRVLLRDLCQYVQKQVEQVAQAEYGNQQAPVCRPAPGGILEMEKTPIARQK